MKTSTGSRFSAFAALLLAACPVFLKAETYEQDFDNFANGATTLADGSTMSGSAKVNGLALELTADGGTGGYGSFTIPALAGSSAGWTATFDLTIIDSAGNNNPADGFSFNYGNFSPGEPGSGEEGMESVASVTSNLSFEMDSWENFDAEQGVNIAEKNGGTTTDLAFNNGPILNDGTSVGGQVTITYDPANGVSFTTNGLLTNANFTNIALNSFVGDDAFIFGFSGRIGGANQTVLIDNLTVITDGNTDTDNDGLPNSWEVDNGLDPDSDAGDDGAHGDPDSDLLTNLQEFQLGTDPQDVDTDDDSLNDNVETMTGIWVSVSDTGTHPLIADTDNDGLPDGLENPSLPSTGPTQPGTDPNSADSDSDGVSDGNEIAVGRDPTVPEPVGDILISEFMASNTSSLLDFQGEASDWIEIHNAGLVPVDLVGWHLTDDSADPTKWIFPSRTIEPGGFLVVFASGKDLTGSELHTNFRLSAGGEYLGLIKPDGIAVSHEFAPVFPSQLSDVSYGLEMSSNESPLIDENSVASYFVPTNGTLGTTWTTSGFDDSSWSTGTNGLGYDTTGGLSTLINTDLRASLQGNNSGAYFRLPFEITGTPDFDSLSIQMTYDDGFSLYLNGSPLDAFNAPANPSWNSTALSENAGGLAISDFSPSETNFALTNHSATPASIIAGANPYLRLIYNGATGNHNSIHFDRTDIGPFSTVTAEFDFRMNGQADGFSFLLLPTGTYGTTTASAGAIVDPAEEPNLPGIFAVGFDIYNNIDEISLHYGSTRAEQNLSGSINLNSNVWHRALITLTPNGNGSNVSVSVIPNVRGAAGAPVVFHNNVLIPNLTPYEYRVQFSARTGGATTNVDLDSINVTRGNSAGGALVTNLNLSQDLSLLQSGTNILAIHGLNFNSSDTDFLVLPKLNAIKITDIDPSSILYFPSPTPGAPNIAGTNNIGGPVTISPPGGTFNTAQSVTLTSSTPASQIRYTTDGTVPAVSSPLYSAPLNLSASTRIRARTFTADSSPGPVSSESYFRLEADLQSFTSDLPIVVLDNFGSGGFPGPGSSFQPMVMAVFDPQTNGRSALTNAPQLITRGGSHTRGSSTAGQSKPNLRIETWGEIDNEDKAVDLLDFPKESDFILYAPYDFDRAFMRNAFMYHLSNQVGQYAVRTRFVEVFANTGGGNLSYASDYHGVYVLMESIKIDNDRVDITKLDPGDNTGPDVSGGYLWKVDRGSPAFFTIGQGDQQVIEDPDPTSITPAQTSYLRGHLNDFGSALTGGNFTDPVLGYAPYINQDSWIDHHLLNVLAFNVDALRLSTFLHKDRNKSIVAGPIWDFDRSLESYDGRDNNPQVWSDSGGTSFFEHGWYDRLFDDPDFAQDWIDRWCQLRLPGGTFTNASLFSVLDAMEAEVTEAAPRNYARWTAVPPNNGGSVAGEVQNIKNWLATRTAWIDSQLAGKVTLSQNGGVEASGFQVTLSGPAGSAIYYTLDGRDPRGDGGTFSGSLYTGPITLNSSAHIVTRAYEASNPTTLFDSRWGGSAQATFVVGGTLAANASNLVITEVHYNPSPPSNAEMTAGFLDADDFEFLELFNPGVQEIDLVDSQFDDGITFTFPLNAIILPGERLILAKTPDAFTFRYGAGFNVTGGYSGTSLSNDGEHLRLLDRDGVLITEFTYNDVWYKPTDGGGYSLELRDPATPLAQLGIAASWGISCEFGGTPGVAGTGFSQEYSIWGQDYFSTLELDDSNISGPLVDLDGDGLDNLMEYALNLNPRVGSSAQGPAAIITDNKLAITFTRWKKALDLSYHAEVSDNLTDWAEVTKVVGTPLDNEDGTETVTIADSQILPDNNRRFIRIRVIQN